MCASKGGEANFADRAASACNVLTAGTEEVAPDFLKALVGESRVAECQKYLEPLTFELLLLALHLTDRMAFANLGPAKRSEFMETLLPAIQQELDASQRSELQGAYNSRNAFYGGFKSLYPEKGRWEGALFWEVGKALASVYADNNPVAAAESCMCAIAFMEGLQNAYQHTGVFP